MSYDCKDLDILIVDGQRIFREGLSTILQTIERIRNVVQVRTAHEALNELRCKSCDLVMVGHVLPSAVNCAACTREIKRLYPNTKVIGLSIHVDYEHVNAMFDNGVDGYLLTDADRIEIEMAIFSVVSGRHYFSKDIASGTIARTIERLEHFCVDKCKMLSEREKEILALLYEELSSKEIAGRLFISERTVEFYRQSLIKKTGARNIVGLIKYAISNSLVKTVE